MAGAHSIVPSKSEKLLGCIISEDLKWKENILGSDQSIIKQVTSIINRLTLVASRADFTTRLMVANGIVVSKIYYLIQLRCFSMVLPAQLLDFLASPQPGD